MKTTVKDFMGIEYGVEIERNSFIRLFGIYPHFTEYDITFRIGDTAEYDSYNFIYTGKIVSITEKSVTFETREGKKRLSLPQFAWRNFDFNLQRVESENAQTMMCI